MKRIVRLTIFGFCTFLISGCYFDEINQPDNAQQNENIQIELNIIDPFASILDCSITLKILLAISLELR